MPTIHQKVVPIQDLHILKDPHFAYLDADKLTTTTFTQLTTVNCQLSTHLPLRIPRKGDTFAPFGMGGRRKLLSDFLTDQKLTLFEKEHQPLLMDGDEIAWVVGRRSSDLYRVDEHTKKVLQLFSE